MALITCPDCGKEFSDQAAACPNCGRPHSLNKPTEVLNNSPDKTIVINNNSSASAYAGSAPTAYVNSRPKNKWIALLLCIFTLCGHKFYEGKIGMGILYLITGGLFGIGWFVDIILLALKPNPYYV